MNYTKEQISEIISKHAVQRNGLNDLLSIMLESMMMAERGEFLREDSTGNKGNGFRPGRTYGQGKRLEFRIPRDRYGNFHPQILAILRDQEEECEDDVRGLTSSSRRVGAADRTGSVLPGSFWWVFDAGRTVNVLPGTLGGNLFVKLAASRPASVSERERNAL